MSVPKKRRASSAGKRRRSHLNLKSTKLIKCSNCGKMKKPHTACLNCGKYKGKEVVKIKSKKKKIKE